MNKKPNRDTIILWWAIGIILMGILPPWVLAFERSLGKLEQPAGYSLIISPPEKKISTGLTDIGWSPKIDWSRLVLQWIIITVAAGSAIALECNKPCEK